MMMMTVVSKMVEQVMRNGKKDNYIILLWQDASSMMMNVWKLK